MSDVKQKYVRPRIVFSRCLRGDNVRYNAELLHDPIFFELKPYVETITVCPEVQMGMPVPRPPIQIHKGDELILFQPSTETDLSRAMADFCNQLNCKEIDGFLLKARSPSCGIIDTPHYAAKPSQEEKPGESEPGKGLFTSIISEKYPNVVFCDEDRFTHVIYRDWFLTSCFTAALLRTDLNTDFKLLKDLTTLNFSFKSDLIELWPKKLYEFYWGLAICFGATTNNLPEFSDDPERQLKHIQSWRGMPSSKKIFRKLELILQPYPAELLPKN